MLCLSAREFCSAKPRNVESTEIRRNRIFDPFQLPRCDRFIMKEEGDTDCDVLLRDICDDSKVFRLRNGTPFALGRNRETKIKDTRCARIQLLLTANLDEETVMVERVGSNPSALNGIQLRKGEKRKANHDDVIEVLESNYFFKIEFPKRNPTTDPENNTTPKQKIPRTVEKVSPFSPNASSSTPMNGSLDHFLKDSAVKSNGSWKSVAEDKMLIFTSDEIQSRVKIAAFDLDGTIITTFSGNVYAKDYNDWKLAFPNVTTKLKELHENEYKIVFFTNQSGIGRGKIRVSDFKKKIVAIVRKLQVPVQVFIACMDDMYRKPRPGMWYHLVLQENDNKDVDMDAAFFCGDAAGRPANCEPNKKKKDFSLADRLFAMNVNMKFFTPEEYFLGWKTAPFDLPKFRPTELPTNGPLLDPTTADLVSNTQEIVIMVGCPGSGKSSFSKKYLESAGYVYVNRDTLKTWQKCVALAEKSVKAGSSVVIDNTNPDKISRARYTSIAKEHNLPIRAFWMSTSLEHAKHNNTFRQLLIDVESHDFIPNHSLNGFINILEPPTLDEGFKEIVRVNFIPTFKNEEQKKLYNMYLLEN